MPEQRGFNRRLLVCASRVWCRPRAIAGALVLAVFGSGCAPVDVPDGPGAQTYLRYCYSCHAAGIAGAPKVGRKDQWQWRAEAGIEALLANTLAGIKPGMPPKGGCRDCSDEELRAAIEHMLAASGLSYSADGTLKELIP